jgi:hypothetical protein
MSAEILRQSIQVLYCPKKRDNGAAPKRLINEDLIRKVEPKRSKNIPNILLQLNLRFHGKAFAFGLHTS